MGADTNVADAGDSYLWLEDVTGDEALDWVRQHNEPTLATLCTERFEQMRARTLAVYDDDSQIPSVGRNGDYLYNFWRDAGHPRGLWRRTTLEEYCKDSPQWDVLIDVDALAAAEDENWVWGGSDVIRPEATRALVGLSRGGADASIVREFDMATRQFVADGFSLPEAKSEIGWEDEDTVLVCTDFGEGSLTESGYPRILKRWRRGTPLDDAETIFSGSVTDVAVVAGRNRYPGFERTFIHHQVDFYNTEKYELRDGELIRIDIPSDSSFAVHREWLMVALKSDWTVGDTTYAAGSVLIADYDQLLAGAPDLQVVFEPGGETFFASGAWTGGRFISIKLRDVTTYVEVVTPGTWQAEPLEGAPENATTVLSSIDDLGDEVFLYTTEFTRPPSLLLGTAAGPVRTIKSSPAYFDPADLEVSQHFATSADGTRIPYFLVAHRDSTEPRPTLLTGYGAFYTALTPNYLSVAGQVWLTRGGAYAVANIRGGGEYGPAWHDQAVRTNRHKVAEDFAAVAQDLVAQGVTTPAQLGADGASAGGLLMGIMLTTYPELFGALVCQQPLLDMSRYHQLLAGASWVAEFGDPDDPAEWDFIKEYSPYHNIDPDRRYPPILITTSTSDDRVHPGHARKMTAALEAAGHHVRYYENVEGGHAGASDNAQAAFTTALVYEFLHQTLNP
jgi:prolyl oligopeptidase